jgi:hypothetical protein
MARLGGEVMSRPLPDRSNRDFSMAVDTPRGGHAGSNPERTTGNPAWTQLYNTVCVMIGDGRLAPDALIQPEQEVAGLWSMSMATVRRAYTALERDGWVARCPDCGRWVVMPMKSCIPMGG